MARSSRNHFETLDALPHEEIDGDQEEEMDSIGEPVVAGLSRKRQGDSLGASTAAKAVCARRAACLAVIAGVSLGVAVALGCAVFFPWFFIDIEPKYALEGRMTPVGCLVLNHTVVGTSFDDDKGVPLYMPGLLVRFSEKKTGSTIETTARPRLAESDASSWMDAEGMTSYFADHPIGATARCYYDPDDPEGRTVMEDGIDGLGAELAACLAVSAFVVVASFCQCCILVAFVSWHVSALVL
jgi:hypothetical protein